jgi:hypothetical protein
MQNACFTYDGQGYLMGSRDGDRLFIGQAAEAEQIVTLVPRCAEYGLRHVQPTSVFWR